MGILGRMLRLLHVDNRHIILWLSICVLNIVVLNRWWATNCQVYNRHMLNFDRLVMIRVLNWRDRIVQVNSTPKLSLLQLDHVIWRGVSVLIVPGQSLFWTNLRVPRSNWYLRQCHILAILGLLRLHHFIVPSGRTDWLRSQERCLISDGHLSLGEVSCLIMVVLLDFFILLR